MVSVCLFFNSSATGWRQQLEMVLPSQGCRELGLACDRPKRGNNISVHSVCLCTDETDRGVDQQDGKNHERSPECEESDASKEEGLKMRLPTRSDMICGYACLRGIVSSKGEIQKVASLCATAEGAGVGGSVQLCEGARDLPCVLTAVLVAGTAAMRNTKRGSWYVEALAQVFCERACDKHVADMLVEVSRLSGARNLLRPRAVLPSSAPALFFTVSLPFLFWDHGNT